MSKRGVGAAGGLLALLLVVAATARTRLFHEGEPPLSSSATHLLLDFAAYLFLVVLLLSSALVVWALWPHEGYDGPQPQRRSIWQTLIQVATLVVATVLVVVVLMVRRRLAAQQPEQSGSAGALGFAPGAIPSAGPGAPPAFDWTAAGLVALTLLVVGAVLWRSWRRRRELSSQRRALAQELSAVVQDTLDDLRLDEDPRRAVIQAYGRMERVLAVHRLPRREAEAPREYLRRALRELPLTPDSIERLTVLFEEARFSTHPISADMRAEAVDALARIRDELTEAPVAAPAVALHAAG